MRVGEALELARVCRQQSKIASNAMTAAVLTDLADRYEAIGGNRTEDRHEKPAFGAEARKEVRADQREARE